MKINIKKSYIFIGILFMASFSIWYVLGCDFVSNNDGDTRYTPAFSVVFPSVKLFKKYIAVSYAPKIYCLVLLLATVLWAVLWIASIVKTNRKFRSVFTVYTAVLSALMVGKFFVSQSLPFSASEGALWIIFMIFSYTFYIAWACLIAIGIINLVYLRKESKQLSTKE